MTIKALKVILRKVMSEYIRKRDSDEHGICKCITCDYRSHWKKMQAGHFIPAAQGNSTRWDETNVHAQCYRCNINLGGNGVMYYRFMEQKYGKDHIEKLVRKSNITVKFSKQDFIDLIDHYKRLTNGM